jgi:monoamine oxidase
MAPNGTSTGDERPLKILIAGGGIGGLSAAIFLRRAGHEVHVSTLKTSACLKCTDYPSRFSSRRSLGQKLVRLFTFQVTRMASFVR